MNRIKTYTDSLIKVLGVASIATLSLIVMLAASGAIMDKTPSKHGVLAKQVEPEKQFSSHRYLSSVQAGELLKQDPGILFVDVRDSLEVAVMGHPKQVDAIVPVRVMSEKFDSELKEYELVSNPEFVNSMNELLRKTRKSKSSMIIVTCGSGFRSALAAQQLTDAGYANVWHIPDGYPGDEKPGLNARNAWQLAGLDWTYAAAPKHAIQRLFNSKAADGFSIQNVNAE